MVAKLFTYIKDCLQSFKNTILKSKPHVYACLFCLALGLLFALGKDYSKIDATKNFVFVVVFGKPSPVPQIIKLFVWLLSIYLVLFLTSIHYICYLFLGYGCIVLSSFLLFSTAFAGIAVHPLTGTIFLILYLIPTIFVSFTGYSYCLREIFNLLNYECNKHSFINVGCHVKTIKKTITTPWLITSLLVTIYWLIFYILLIIFV